MISAAMAVLENEEQRNELSEIYKKNIEDFYSIAMYNLHNKEDCEDAIQEAFLSVAVNPDLFFAVPKENRVKYMKVIIRNISYKIWHKRQKIEENQVEFNDDIADDSISPDEQIVSEYSCEEIYSFIDTLSEPIRAAIYMKIHLKMKYSDVAEKLGISEEAAKKRVERAITQIKHFMEGKDDE